MVKPVRTAFRPGLRGAVARGVGRFVRAELCFPAYTAPVVPLVARERLPPRQPPPRYHPGQNRYRLVGAQANDAGLGLGARAANKRKADTDKNPALRKKGGNK